MVFGRPAGQTAQWLHDQYVEFRSKQYDGRFDQSIYGATCSRFSDRNNASRTHWECLLGEYNIVVAKQEEYGVKIDEVAMLRTLVQRLGGGPQLTPAEIAFRNVLFRTGLKFGGDAARSCLDEVMNTAEAAAANNPTMADEIAQLRKAAARAHAIEVLAAVPVGPAHFDDFDPKWWDALKEVVPNPTSTPDPQDTATDRVIDLLPPQAGGLGRDAHRRKHRAGCPGVGSRPDPPRCHRRRVQSTEQLQEQLRGPAQGVCHHGGAR